MTRQIFVLPPIPPSSRALVDALKRRLTQAIEVGKPGDARIYLNIIERLARMAWLDDTLLAEKEEDERQRKARVMADIDCRLAPYLKQIDVEDAQQAHQVRAKTEPPIAAQTEVTNPWALNDQIAPDASSTVALATTQAKYSHAKAPHRIAAASPSVRKSRKRPNMARQSFRADLTSGNRLPP